MSKNIRISEKHGVNPTIPICFWCGEEKNEVALLGKLKGDKEAPMRMIIDYEPCDKCKGSMEGGITFVQAVGSPVNEGQGEIQKGIYPTGKWAVLKEEAVKNMVTEEAVLAQILEKRKCFIAPETWDAIGLPK